MAVIIVQQSIDKYTHNSDEELEADMFISKFQ